MNEQFICESNKFSFKNEVISLLVSLKNLPNQIEVEGYTLFLKTSFHASLVCIEKIIEKHNILIPDFKEQVLTDFCQFVHENDISLMQYKNEFRFVSENERKSVVVMCDISNLDAFFESLNKKYALQIETQPTHVTLYTLQPEAGIFLTSKQDIQKLSKIINLNLVLN